MPSQGGHKTRPYIPKRDNHLMKNDVYLWSIDQAHQPLTPAGFADWPAVHRLLLRIADSPETTRLLSDMLPHLLRTLSNSANPDRVMVSLERLVRSSSDRTALLRTLADHPRATETLIALFAGSQFLGDILLRHPDYIDLIMSRRALTQSTPLDCAQSPGPDYQACLEALRRWQRRELLRIGVCDLLGLLDLTAITAQLSHLADQVTRHSLDLVSAETGISAQGFVVLAMGKLGGSELNYSSDIDLLFLAAENAHHYIRLGERLIDALSCATAEGFMYRVDMRLRPWGQAGPLVVSIAGYRTYLEKHARLWEKQALLKARSIAGDQAVGDDFLAHITPLLFAAPLEQVRADVYAMKHRTESWLRQQGRAWGEVKLGEGSIRDIEFVAQYLQLAHGGDCPAVCCRNTLDTLDRLETQGLISTVERRVLSDGYVFLRTLEHYMQMMNYQQTYTLPTDAAALAQLARRLGFQGQQAGDHLIARYEEHRAAIRAIYLCYLGSSLMNQPPVTPPLITRHLARLDAAYGDVFGADEIAMHATLADQLGPDCLAQVHAVPLPDGRWRVTLIGYDYPGILSLICGLLFVYGFSILDGHVFTYEPTAAGRKSGDHRRKIVDAFTVHPTRLPVSEQTWLCYADNLTALLRLVAQGQESEARGSLANQVAAALPDIPGATAALYPIDIEIDNDSSENYTVLLIDTQDTIGFLYELTNALALRRIYIARVTVESAGNRVHDTLYVTDSDGRKIGSPDSQRELRAATVLIKHFTHLLPHSPKPESALLRFRQFVSQLFQRPNWPDELASLENPAVLSGLAQVLGVSDFLWDDFLRMQYANLFPVVRDMDALTTARSQVQLQAALQAALDAQPGFAESKQAALNAFKDREMFRIDMRHILGHTQEFEDFSHELTDLAQVVVNAAYHLCHEELRLLHGSPCLDDSLQPSDMSVCALGKCGGYELGFASDIELMFIYAGNGKTAGPQVISSAEFYEKLVQMFVRAIHGKREGIFEIDLRLRPYGQAGSMAVSLEALRRYFAPDGPAWAYERQALVKLRPIAGNAELGRQIVGLRDECVYTGRPFDVTAMRAMRERQIRHLVTGGTFNAKFSPGGLVDVEYLVQGLQITHGHRDPHLRETNIRQAMSALVEAGILSPDDYTHLRRAHTFLRWLIDGLRMVRGNAQDLTVPPPDSEAFAFLSRRLRYGRDTERLRQELERHTTQVRELNARLLGQI